MSLFVVGTGLTQSVTIKQQPVYRQLYYPFIELGEVRAWHNVIVLLAAAQTQTQPHGV